MPANVDGTLAVLEASRHAGVRKLVYAASSSCYGLAASCPPPRRPHPTRVPLRAQQVPGRERGDPLGPDLRLPVISIRMFNVYGPRVRTTGAYGAVFGVFLAQKLHGQPFTVVGDGTQRRDFVYVTDVARAYLLAAESNAAGEVFNVGAGDPQTVNRLVELLGGQVVHVPKRPGEPDCTWADTPRSRPLGWKPVVSFEDGVAAMLRTSKIGVGPPVDAGEDRDRHPDVVRPPRRDEERLPAQDQDAGGSRRRHRAAAAPEERDHVPRHVRHRAPRPSPPPDVRQAEGGHPDRQPDRRRPRHEGGLRPYVPRSFAPNLAALEVVDYVIVDRSRRRSRTSGTCSPTTSRRATSTSPRAFPRRPRRRWRRSRATAGRSCSHRATSSTPRPA